MSRSIEIRTSVSFDPAFVCSIVFNAYEVNRQKVDRTTNEWVIDETRSFFVKDNNVIQIRKTTDDDLHSVVAYNVKFPYEFCTLEYYDEYEKKKKIAIIVGNSDEIEQQYKKIKEKIEKTRKKFDESVKELRNKLNDEVEKIIKEFHL